MPRKKVIKSMNDVTTNEVEVNTAPKTTAEKLAAAKRLVAKYEQELANEAIKTDIQIGDEVTFSYGLGDKARNLEGKVVAVKQVDEGTRKGLNVAILSGEGFDTETFKVHVRSITSNKTSDERNAVDAPEGEGDVSEVDPMTVN